MQSRITFTRVVLILAMIVIILIGIHVAAPILTPLLFALMFSLILSPLYAWLRRKLPALLALLVLLIRLTILFVLIFAIFSASISRLSAQLSTYAAQLTNQEAQLQDWLQSLDLAKSNLTSFFNANSIIQLGRAFLSSMTNFLSSLFLVLMTLLFLLVEGPALMARLLAGVSAENPHVARLADIGRDVAYQFSLRSIVNLATGAGVAILLFFLGVDFALLWGILTFLLSYIPYIGLFLATAPSVLLAFIQYGIVRALVVIIGVVIINLLAENLLSPALMSRGLRLSPTIVFISFAFWTWMLGAPGAILAMPITSFLVVMFDTFPRTRWLAGVMGARQTPHESP
jgi:AI-2 transport protein TqsA